MTKNDKILITIGVIALISSAGLATVSVMSDNKSNSTTNSTNSTTSTNSSTSSSSSDSSNTTSTTDSSSSTTSSSYKDGSYTASASYSVPHGYQNSISATITVSDGKITAVTADHNYSDNESGMYIDSFNNSVSSTSVGQSLSSYSPSRIGGASLTTAAFDDALNTVKTNAAV